MQKSPMIYHLEVAIKLAEYEERVFIGYLIKMAIDEARKADSHKAA